MERGKLLYEGKAKKIFAIKNSSQVIQHFKDDATAFDGIKKGSVTGKGVANNTISSALFQLLETTGIKTHFEKKISDNEMLVKHVEIVPVEVVVRNVSTGSLCKRYGVKEGIVFDKPIIEFYYKNDAMHDPLMNEDHITVLNIAKATELKKMRTEAIKINKILL